VIPGAAASAALAAACAIAFLAPACGGREPKARDGAALLLETSVGPALDALWKAHGGLDAWRRVGEVRFEYEAEISTPREGLPEDTVRVGPAAVRFVPGDWEAVEVDDGSGPRSVPVFPRGDDGVSVDPEAPVSGQDELFRSIRVLVQFPFALADPVWEFRRQLVAGEPPDPWTFLVSPAGTRSFLGTYLVAVDPSTGLPQAVCYRSQDPAFRGKLVKAVFGPPAWVGGIRMPSEIIHSIWEPGESRYPWEAPRENDGWRTVMRERIRGVELSPVDRSASGEIHHGGTEYGRTTTGRTEEDGRGR
jgi:hypothetical protein